MWQKIHEWLRDDMKASGVVKEGDQTVTAWSTCRDIFTAKLNAQGTVKVQLAPFILWPMHTKAEALII